MDSMRKSNSEEQISSSSSPSSDWKERFLLPTFLAGTFWFSQKTLILIRFTL
uniref:Protein translocase n=1 Tax=Solanum tuberosum TaxID=4113 RepID=M1BZR2_SOLTU